MLKFITLGLALALGAAVAQDTTPAPAPADTQNQSAPAAGNAIQQAQTLADQARKAYPKNAWNIDKPLWKQAADAAEQAVSAAPSDANALLLRARIYTDVGFWRRAELSWDAYLKAVPGDQAGIQTAATVQYNLGYLAYQRGSLPESKAAFQKCLGLNAQDARCAQWAGRVALEGADFQGALTLYQQAVQLAPGDKVSAYFLGVARNAANYGPAATRSFSRAYQDYDAGRKAQALAGYKEATASAPTFIEAWREQGRLALELGDAASAQAAYDAASKLPGATASDKYNLGVAQEGARFGLPAVKAFRDAYGKYTAGDKAAAEAGFQAATQASDSYQKAWAWLGRARYDQKNYTGAVEAYTKATQLDPNDKASAYYLGLAKKGK